MTKFSLSINTDDAGEIARILAALGGATTSGIQAVLQDDDDNGPVNATAPAVDSSGLPWDERIHGKAKSVNKDGTWRKAKGVDASLVASVEAELRARSAGPLPNVAAPFPASNPPQTAPASPGLGFPPAAPQVSVPTATTPAAVPPSAPMPQSAPTPEQAAPILDFTRLMMAFQAAMNAGKMDQNSLANYVAQLNAWQQTAYSAVTDLAANPQHILPMKQLLERDGLWLI